MGFVRFLLWTTLAVGVGIFVASWRPGGGQTPVEQAQVLWKEGLSGPRAQAWKREAAGAWGHFEASLSRLAAKVKPASARGTEAAAWAPAERHTPEDRRALQKLISNRTDKQAPTR